MEKVRCCQCRGTKKYAGLGGIIGDCRLCKGTGLMDKVEIVKQVEVIEPLASIVDQVANAIPPVIERPVITLDPEVEEVPMKLDAKKVIFKRKGKVGA